MGWSVATLLIVATSVLSTSADEKKRAVTECDKKIAKTMCDEFQNDVAECADKMYYEEHPPFFSCCEEHNLGACDTWNSVARSLCGEGNTVEAFHNLTECWNEKMETRAYEMKNQYAYAEDHFLCKKEIIVKTMDRMPCPCRLEKGYLCDTDVSPSKFRF